MKIATFWSSIPSPSLPTEKSGIFKEHKSTPIAIWSISLILLVSVVNTIVDCLILLHEVDGGQVAVELALLQRDVGLRGRVGDGAARC